MELGNCNKTESVVDLESWRTFVALLFNLTAEVNSKTKSEKQIKIKYMLQILWDPRTVNHSIQYPSWVSFR